MPRYIDVDAFEKEGWTLHRTYRQDLNTMVFETMKSSDFPTVDAVEVVRCKDCVHGIPTRIDTVTGEFSDERYCYRHHMCHFEDYYCADGKRKEGGAE